MQGPDRAISLLRAQLPPRCVVSLRRHSYPPPLTLAPPQSGADAVLKNSLSSRLKSALQKEKTIAAAARTSAALKHLSRPLQLAPALITASSSSPNAAKHTPANSTFVLDPTHMRKPPEVSRSKKPTGQTYAPTLYIYGHVQFPIQLPCSADTEMTADVLLVLAELSDKLLREGAFNGTLPRFDRALTFCD